MTYLTGEERNTIVIFYAGDYAKRTICVLIYLMLRPLFR